MKKITAISVMSIAFVFTGCENVRTTTPPKAVIDTEESSSVTEEPVDVREIPLIDSEGNDIPVVEEDVTPVTEEDNLSMPGMDHKPQKSTEELVRSVESFTLENDNYLFCLNEAVTGCQQNAVQEEIQKTKSVKPCNYLGDEAEKTSCRNGAWMNLAVMNKDLDACGNITDASMGDSCLTSVLTQIAVASGSVEGCTKIKDELSQKQCQNSAYNQLAVKNLDPQICDKIISDVEGEKEMCKDMVRMEQEMRREQQRMEEEMRKKDQEMEAQMQVEQAQMEPVPVEPPVIEEQAVK